MKPMVAAGLAVANAASEAASAVMRSGWVIIEVSCLLG
jgi:hypothetical protein